MEQFVQQIILAESAQGKESGGGGSWGFFRLIHGSSISANKNVVMPDIYRGTM